LETRICCAGSELEPTGARPSFRRVLILDFTPTGRRYSGTLRQTRPRSADVLARPRGIVIRYDRD
jgi:hypothetical protein